MHTFGCGDGTGVDRESHIFRGPSAPLGCHWFNSQRAHRYCMSSSSLTTTVREITVRSLSIKDHWN